MRIAMLEDRAGFAKDLITVIKEMEEAASVKHYQYVDEALEALDKGEVFDVWVVDLMMPSGNRFSSEETENGSATGTRFLEYLSTNGGGATKGIVVMTSRDTAPEEMSGVSLPIKECLKAESVHAEIAKEILSWK